MSNPDYIKEEDFERDNHASSARGGSGLAARALASRQAGAGATYLDGLNPEQQRAVETLNGPVLVLAGAGTGKTRVLTARIAHILATGSAWPSQILAVTFTNKAAREMKERIGNFVGEQIEGMPWLGTFHSIGVKILRRHAELVELKSGFSILDTDDQIRLLKQLIRAEGIDDKRWPARLIAGLIDQWKNKGLSPDKISAGDAQSYANGRGKEIYALYQERLKVLNAVDFGDLLTENIRLFMENPDVLAEYQQRFKFMLVDEYQDTNVAQYLWLRLLAQKPADNSDEPVRPNICCVGDDDQSIYGWRGAEVDNILRFEKDFPGAAIIKLERNYRSSEHILGAASHLISHNKGRLGKTLFTDLAKPDETKVKITACWDSEEEARAIGEEIEQLQRRDHKLNDMAILVRASFQMREFEERFMTLGLSYRVIGGPRFYERMEIRDALAYLRVVAQPADDLAFERIVNTPKRGIGEATVRQIHDAARARGIPLMEAARDLVETEELRPKTRSTLKALLDNFSRWSSQIETMAHNELAEMILDESGYTAMWQNDRAPEAPGRLENLKELTRAMEEFENLRGFLEHVSLVMDASSEDELDAVSIMTLHSAKGLEFDTVFLPGWEEGLFPHQRSLDENGRAGLEEERRLAYVGITRAKKNCLIWFTSNRRIHGLWQNVMPSRFIDELPENHVEIAEGGQNYGGYGRNHGEIGGLSQKAGGAGGYGTSRFDVSDPLSNSGYASPGFQRMKRNVANRVKQDENGYAPSSADRHAPIVESKVSASSFADQNDASGSKFNIGDRVFHMKFGNGNIASIDGNKLTIDFDKAGQKRVLDNFVEAV